MTHVIDSVYATPPGQKTQEVDGAPRLELDIVNYLPPQTLGSDRQYFGNILSCVIDPTDAFEAVEISVSRLGKYFYLDS